jgi:7,8-dihydropterin-6-yl-methyl-4-(beta-D-ribofuranosyl)aminobenzene 5'-phosphate synthase
LGIGWDDVDAVFFSHFHPDHVGGTEAWKAGKVALGRSNVDLHDKAIFVPSKFNLPGSAATLLLPDPYVIEQGVASLGAIEYAEVYPVSLYKASGAEQVLAVNVAGEGIVLIMGCGHPTVERILARAETLFNQPVIGIVGGVHYEGMSARQAQVHIDLLQSRNLKLAAPSPHDSSPEALQVFREAFGEKFVDVMVGVPIRFGE